MLFKQSRLARIPDTQSPESAWILEVAKYLHLTKKWSRDITTMDLLPDM